MTAWDLSSDPGASTINQTWMCENGGGYFGVPLVNFLGWTFTVYLFTQVFALYLRGRGPLLTAEPDRATASDLQGVLLYAAMAISFFFATLFNGDRRIVTDATGTTWRTGDIYETAALVTIYGMFFIVVLALLRQRRTSAPAYTKPLRLQEVTEGSGSGSTGQSPDARSVPVVKTSQNVD